MTQTDITKASQDLSRKLNEKDNLNLQINEEQQQREKLKQRQSALTKQIQSLGEQQAEKEAAKKPLSPI